MQRRYATIAAAALLIAVAGSFFGLQIAKAITKPLGLIDDGYFALIAKHLAGTLSYGVPISNEKVSLFDAAVGAGPALILPGAFAIAIFGPQPWLPGLVTIVIFTAEIAALTRILFRTFGESAFVYVALSLVALVGLTRPDNDYYYAYLGEAPMLGFLLLAAALFARDARASTLVTAATSCALAILTKQSAVYAVAGICGVWFVVQFARGRTLPLRSASIVITVITVPLVTFEAIKIATLGWAGYLMRLRELVSFLANRGPPADRISELQHVVMWGYWVSLSIGAIVVLSIFVMAVRCARPSSRPRAWMFMAMLLAGAAVHFAWWIGFSAMWPRWVWPTVGLAAFAVSAPILGAGWRLMAPYTAAVVACFGSAVAISISAQAAGIDGSYSKEKKQLLDIIERRPDLPVVSTWWGSFYDIVYLLPDRRKWFWSSAAPTLNAIVVGRKKRIAKADVEKMDKTCRNLMPDATHFMAYLCGK